MDQNNNVVALKPARPGEPVCITKVRIKIDLRRDGVPVEESGEANLRRLVETLRDFADYLVSDDVRSEFWYSVAGGEVNIHGVGVRYKNLIGY